MSIMINKLQMSARLSILMHKLQASCSCLSFSLVFRVRKLDQSEFTTGDLGRVRNLAYALASGVNFCILIVELEE